MGAAGAACGAAVFGDARCCSALCAKGGWRGLGGGGGVHSPHVCTRVCKAPAEPCGRAVGRMDGQMDGWTRPSWPGISPRRLKEGQERIDLLTPFPMGGLGSGAASCSVSLSTGSILLSEGGGPVLGALLRPHLPAPPPSSSPLPISASGRSAARGGRWKIAGRKEPKAGVINIERVGFRCRLQQLCWLQCHTISPQVY